MGPRTPGKREYHWLVPDPTEHRAEDLEDPVWRKVAVPLRLAGDKIVIARPADGVATLLDTTAATVWHLLGESRTRSALSSKLGEIFPAIDRVEREDACSQILAALERDGLVERG